MFLEWWNDGRWDRLTTVPLSFLAPHGYDVVYARALFKLERPDLVFRIVDAAGVPLPGVL